MQCMWHAVSWWPSQARERANTDEQQKHVRQPQIEDGAEQVDGIDMIHAWHGGVQRRGVGQCSDIRAMGETYGHMEDCI